jgi:hypothetical protein
MATFGRHDDLLRQIPDDVKERASKAGVTTIDWYAGRLTSDGKKGFTEVPPSRYHQLRLQAKTRRKNRRTQKASDIAAPVTKALAWLRLRPRRATRHAP